MRALLLVAILLAPAAVPGVAAAHGGAGAWIHVPSPTIAPGAAFELWGADLAPNASVAVAFRSGDRALDLGQVATAEDGHFTVTLQLPASAPLGYGEVVATDPQGNQAMVWVLVVSDPTAPAAQAAAWWSDPSVLILGAFLIGGLAGLAYAVWRRRSTARHEPVAVRPTTTASRRRARRRS